MKRLFPPFISSLLVLLIITSCKSTANPDEIVKNSFPEFYKEGHRGARGLLPENTIASMKKAIDDGANFIELDIQISKDHQVIVAHDPTINRKITLTPEGEEIPENAENLVLYQMPYELIRKYDVGSKHNKAFPQQQNMPAYIPLLGELIDSVETYISENSLPKVIYNIEVKANPEKDGIYQPEPKVYMDLVMEVVKEKGLDFDRYQIQSFDMRQIQEIHKRYPSVVTAFLTGDKEKSLEQNIEALGYTPQIYSPSYKLVTSELINKAHSKGMKLVPWTVNQLPEMKRLKEMGVDGIITDYPHLLNQL